MQSKLVKSALALSIVGTTIVSAFADNIMTASMNMEFNSNLSLGSRGNDVISLQKLLGVSTTGFFGRLTRNALMNYQKENGISATGYFGPITRNKFKNNHMMMNDNAGTGVMVGGAAMLPNRDIVDNAVLASNVTTVVAAVKAAGLVDTLKSEGPFTVFAPNNDAFAALPAGTVASLLLPENKAKLVDILTYHVVAGRYTSADIKDGMTLKTVEGKNLTFTKVNGNWMINGTVGVETADVISKNGVTFVIKGVLMPPAM